MVTSCTDRSVSRMVGALTASVCVGPAGDLIFTLPLWEIRARKSFSVTLNRWDFLDGFIDGWGWRMCFGASALSKMHRDDVPLNYSNDKAAVVPSSEPGVVTVAFRRAYIWYFSVVGLCFFVWSAWTLVVSSGFYAVLSFLYGGVYGGDSLVLAICVYRYILCLHAVKCDLFLRGSYSNLWGSDWEYCFLFPFYIFYWSLLTETKNQNHVGCLVCLLNCAVLLFLLADIW